ncbi:MAG: 3-dehydroquinate synthase [Acidobacteria bacterium]|nr:3-dehydroquinate synthase [Acidobacteriota bacterium]
MERIEVASERGAYRVLVGEQILPELPHLLEEARAGRGWPVVTDATVGPLWGATAAARLGSDPPLELPAGEPAKRWPQVERICRWLLRRGAGRGAFLVGVGGGVVTDMTGFAAAIFLRGISWAAVPTTLLAMVDASVGGKTGINLDEGKNLIGAFWPPSLVVADVDTLSTLPLRELRAGLAEAIKTAWIGDRSLLELIPDAVRGYSKGRAERWIALVAGSVRVKARVVREDEREAGARQALNLGHTVAHALEAATGYERFLHGEAVAWGLRAAVRLARSRGVLSAGAGRRLLDAVACLEPLPPVHDLDAGTVLAHLAVDKKRDAGGIAWVLPTDEGVVLRQRIEPAEILEVLGDLQRHG